MPNTSGIHPTGSTVLVLLDEVPKTAQGGVIEIPASIVERDQIAQIRATLIEIGPLAWTEDQEKLTEEQRASRRVPVGSRIIFRKYAGEYVLGSDGIKYRIINAKDIYATFTNEAVKVD